MDTQTQSDKADELFNLTLEVEGLLALIRRREDFTAPEVYTMLLDKVAALAEGVGELCPEPASASPKCEGTANQTLTKEQKFLESVPSLPGLWDDDCDSDEVGATEAEMEETVSEAERSATEATEAQTAAETPAEVAATEAKVNDQIASAVLFETEEDADETPTMAAEERVPQAPTRKHQPGDLRRSFTINDKFRFRRELFGNSDSEFTDALNLVEAMSSYEEAEDYFITDLGWDREMPEVGEFLTGIEHYFN